MSELKQGTPLTSTEWRRTGTAVIDDDVSIQTSPSPVKKRRGRPLGAQAIITTAGRELTADDFAFLRACLQGLTSNQAGRQYLSHVPSGKYEAYREEIEARLSLVVRDSQDVSLRDLLELAFPKVNTPEQPATRTHSPVKKKPRPSLEEFAEQFPPDMYSEDELIDEYVRYEWGPEYETETDQPANTARDDQVQVPVPTMSMRLDALFRLQRQFTETPLPTDSVQLWFTSELASTYAKLDIFTLADLATWIYRQGPRWYLCVEDLGRARAKRISSWLSNSVDIGKLGVPSSAEVSPLLKPLEKFTWPENLWRAIPYSNSLLSTPERMGGVGEGAHPTNDRAAVFDWLKRLEGKSSATQRAYRHAVELFVLWAIAEKRMALSALTSSNLLEFAEFLGAPPAHWCSVERSMKSSAKWRPLRGPVGDKAITLIMSAVTAMFTAWQRLSYMPQPPRYQKSRSLIAPVSEKKSLKLTMRPVAKSADSNFISDHYRVRRMRVVNALLGLPGVTPALASKLTWKDLKLSALGWTLYIEEKDRAPRELLLSQSIWTALEAHYEDRRTLISRGRLRTYLHLSKEDSPLISILDGRLAMAAPCTAGDASHNAPRKANPNGAVSASRLYRMLNTKTLPEDPVQFRP